MSNENVGLRCPECGKDNCFRVEIKRKWATLSNGLRYTQHVVGEANMDDKCCCAMGLGGCGHTTTLANFRAKSVAQMLLEVAEMYDAAFEKEERGLSRLGLDIKKKTVDAIAAYKKRGLDG